MEQPGLEPVLHKPFLFLSFNIKMELPQTVSQKSPKEGDTSGTCALASHLEVTLEATGEAAKPA